MSLMKLDQKTKLAMVKDHFENGLTIKETSEKYNYSKTGIKYLCRLYREYGADAFNKKITTYNRETKLNIIKRVLKDNESVRSIAIEYGLKDPTIIRDWIAKYKKGGELAIQDTHSRHNYKLHNDKIVEKEHKKLLEDLKRTKAENEYLKKLYSLILNRSGKDKNTKSKSSKN